jgi:predicted DNA-binding transcriptional regulator AlpA
MEDRPAMTLEQLLLEKLGQLAGGSGAPLSQAPLDSGEERAGWDLPPDLRSALALKRIVPEPQVAELIGTSVTHLRRLRRAGLAPRHTALGKRRLGYRLDHVLSWLDQRSEPTA